MPTLDQRVRNFLNDSFLFGRGTDDLASDDSLVESGIIDSTGVLELVAFLEESFHVRVDDDELVPQNLDSINRIVQFVETKLSAPATCV